MSFSDMDVERWFGLDDVAAQLLAGQIAAATGSVLIEVRPHVHFGRRGRIAVFRNDEALYAFVPGGETTVGYDGNQFAPNPAQSADYRDSAEEHGLPSDIREYIDEMTSPVRTVSVAPMLVAVDAVEAGGPQLPDTETTAEWVLIGARYNEEITRLSRRGRRLLTPDEWEHACGAGVTTLFRWGDYSPADRYPLDDDDFPHRSLNAFGLNIAQNPLRDERTADPTVICGGDGGSAIRGGSGFFLGWLTLATAYRDRDYVTWVAENPDEIDQLLVRPVIPLR
jgi:hypothetical protein